MAAKIAISRKVAWKEFTMEESKGKRTAGGRSPQIQKTPGARPWGKNLLVVLEEQQRGQSSWSGTEAQDQGLANHLDNKAWPFSHAELAKRVDKGCDLSTTENCQITAMIHAWSSCLWP